MPDDPIKIGGGSVTIEFSDVFNPDSGPSGRKKFKQNQYRLVRILVNGQEVATLKERDVVEIVCNDGKP